MAAMFGLLSYPQNIMNMINNIQDRHSISIIQKSRELVSRNHIYNPLFHVHLCFDGEKQKLNPLHTMNDGCIDNISNNNFILASVLSSCSLAIGFIL